MRKACPEVVCASEGQAQLAGVSKATQRTKSRSENTSPRPRPKNFEGHIFKVKVKAKIEAKANKIRFYAKVKAMDTSLVLTRVFDSSWQIDSRIEPV